MQELLEKLINWKPNRRKNFVFPEPFVQGMDYVGAQRQVRDGRLLMKAALAGDKELLAATERFANEAKKRSTL